MIKSSKKMLQVSLDKETYQAIELVVTEMSKKLKRNYTKSMFVADMFIFWVENVSKIIKHKKEEIENA